MSRVPAFPFIRVFIFLCSFLVPPHLPLPVALALAASLTVLIFVRIQKKAELNAWDHTSFFGGTSKGYTDYPAMDN